jgi:hypothetical protein
MQDPKLWAGGVQEEMPAAEREEVEREEVEREWDEAEHERAPLIEAWKERYRQEGKNPETIQLDWDTVFAERDEG